MKNKSNIAKVALTVGLLVGTGAAAFGVTSVANAATSSQGKAAKILKKKAAKKSTASNKSTASAQAVTSTTVPAVPQSISGEADGMRHRRGPINLDNVAKVLGITTAELRTELQTKSFATIAKEKNVDIQKVKDAITADVKAHLDEEVASGEHTQAEADAKLAKLKTRLDDIVNGVRPAGGPGMGGRGHHGGRGGRGHGMGGASRMPSMLGSMQSSVQGASFNA